MNWKDSTDGESKINDLSTVIWNKFVDVCYSEYSDKHIFYFFSRYPPDIRIRCPGIRTRYRDIRIFSHIMYWRNDLSTDTAIRFEPTIPMNCLWRTAWFRKISIFHLLDLPRYIWQTHSGLLWKMEESWNNLGIIECSQWFCMLSMICFCESG